MGIVFSILFYAVIFSVFYIICSILSSHTIVVLHHVISYHIISLHIISYHIKTLHINMCTYTVYVHKKTVLFLPSWPWFSEQIGSHQVVSTCHITNRPPLLHDLRVIKRTCQLWQVTTLLGSCRVEPCSSNKKRSNWSTDLCAGKKNADGPCISICSVLRSQYCNHQCPHVFLV